MASHRGGAVWQQTNVTRGEVLAFGGFESRCVALFDVGGRYRVMYSTDHGCSWSTPWPDLPDDLLVTALFASSDALYLGVLIKGIIRGAYPEGGEGSRWEDARVHLPEDVAVTCMARWNDVILAGTRRHGIFEGAADGWRTIGAAEGRSEDSEAVAALIVVGGRLVGVGTRGIFLIEEEGRKRLSDPQAPATPTGISAFPGRGVIAWSPRSVHFSQHIGAAWLGLPEPPRETLVRSVAVAGRRVVAVIHGPGGSSLHRWSYGAHDWTPFHDGLPLRVRPSVVHATGTGVVVGMAGRGIYRLPFGPDERLLPPGTLWLEDAPTLQMGSTIRFTVHRAENLHIQLHGPDGECIRDLSFDRMPAGTHEVTIADESVSPGIYTFTIRSQGLSQAGRRVILP